MASSPKSVLHWEEYIWQESDRIRVHAKSDSGQSFVYIGDPRVFDDKSHEWTTKTMNQMLRAHGGAYALVRDSARSSSSSSSDSSDDDEEEDAKEQEEQNSHVVGVLFRGKLDAASMSSSTPASTVSPSVRKPHGKRKRTTTSTEAPHSTVFVYERHDNDPDHRLVVANGTTFDPTTMTTTDLDALNVHRKTILVHANWLLIGRACAETNHSLVIDAVRGTIDAGANFSEYVSRLSALETPQTCLEDLAVLHNLGSSSSNGKPRKTRSQLSTTSDASDSESDSANDGGDSSDEEKHPYGCTIDLFLDAKRESCVFAEVRMTRAPTAFHLHSRTQPYSSVETAQETVSSVATPCSETPASDNSSSGGSDDDYVEAIVAADDESIDMASSETSLPAESWSATEEKDDHVILPTATRDRDEDFETDQTDDTHSSPSTMTPNFADLLATVMSIYPVPVIEDVIQKLQHVVRVRKALDCSSHKRKRDVLGQPTVKDTELRRAEERVKRVKN